MYSITASTRSNIPATCWIETVSEAQGPGSAWTRPQNRYSFRSGELTCRRLVELYLERIEAYDKSGPELNSIITINPSVLEEAEELDRSFQQAREFAGPLHGIPVLVKDQAETAGIRTTFGSVAFEDYIPEVDATAVRKLKEAGAVILAKTNLPDFATSWFAYSSAGGVRKSGCGV